MPVLSEEEKRLMRKAGSILKDCFEALSREVKVGVSTKVLEKKVDDFIVSKNARCAFRGYKGFPGAICASKNSVVVHGIPSERDILKDGDIISIDIGAECGGLFADAAKTFTVGRVSDEAERLIEVTRQALAKGIEMATAGNHVEDISWAIQSFVESNSFNVVRSFVGHGIGTKIHEEPEVPNFGRPHKGRLLEKGMALAIEPMVNAGTGEVEILEDGWTAVTKDGRLSAHFEHTVIVDLKTAEVIT